MEFYRFLGVADDVRRFGGPLPPVQMYKMPGGTEPVAKWKLYEDMKTTADRPEVDSDDLPHYKSSTDGL